MINHHKFADDSRGFSLVEVTIAMAIASVALVTLMGLLPQGMKTMEEAGDKAIEARVQQQILNELQLTPFDDKGGTSLLDSYYDKLEVYYDSQGEEISHSKNQGAVPADKKAGSFSHIYSARITVPEKGDKLPRSVGGGTYTGFSLDQVDENSNVRPVILEFAAVGGGGGNFKWDEDGSQPLISTHQSLVVKMGRDYK